MRILPLVIIASAAVFLSCAGTSDPVGPPVWFDPDVRYGPLFDFESPSQASVWRYPDDSTAMTISSVRAYSGSSSLDCFASAAANEVYCANQGFDLRDRTVSVKVWFPRSALNGTAFFYYQDGGWSWDEGPHVTVSSAMTNAWTTMSWTLDASLGTNRYAALVYVNRIGMKMTFGAAPNDHVYFDDWDW
jgi:hypothetical protein